MLLEDSDKKQRCIVVKFQRRLSNGGVWQNVQEEMKGRTNTNYECRRCGCQEITRKEKNMIKAVLKKLLTRYGENGAHKPSLRGCYEVTVPDVLKMKEVAENEYQASKMRNATF